jgi:hypothetical protein
MFFISCTEVPTRLSHVFQWATTTLGSWYIPLSLKMSDMWFLGFRWFFVVLVVLNYIRIFVFLSSFVISLVSLPVYVNVAHFFLVSGGVICSRWFDLAFLPCQYVG